MHRRFLFIASIIWSLAIHPVSAEPLDRPVWTFTLENDLPADTDRYYTNGFRIGRTSALNDVPTVMIDAASSVLGPIGDVRWRAGLGQSLYTPTEIDRETPNPTDQPYAAWLYGTVGLINDVTLDGHSRQTSVLLSLGVVGPAALGEQTQDFVHDLIGSQDPQGWDSQLDNEPALLLTVERRWVVPSREIISGLRADLAPHAGLALGNVFTHAAAGMTLRFGEPPNGDYGPPRIQPHTPGSEYFAPATDGASFNWYVFTGIEGRAVARNIFLDGNTFGDSASVEKNPFVMDASAGAVVVIGNLRLAYIHALRTQEFEGQAGPSVFSGLSVGWRF